MKQHQSDAATTCKYDTKWNTFNSSLSKDMQGRKQVAPLLFFGETKTKKENTLPFFLFNSGFIILLTLLISSSANAQICFSSPTDFVAGANSTFSIASADFNGDGFADLVVDNQSTSNTVSILLGNGNGSFGTESAFATGVQPNVVICADFNGDGKIDLAVTNYTSNDVSILLGTGTGSFGAPTNYTVGTQPQSVISADFNGDGKADLAVTNQNSSDVSILLGTGNGTFGTATNFAAGSGPYGLVSADFNLDGNADLAVADFYGSNNITVLLGTGTGNFGAATSFTVGSNPTEVTSADFNGDGNPDLAVSNNSGGTTSILMGNGLGSFSAATTYTTGGTTSFHIINADFNGDGFVDLATSNPNGNNVSVLLGYGNGTFVAAANFATGNTPYSIVGADFNGDGKIDLATANNVGSTVSILLNTPPTPVTPGAITGINQQCPGLTVQIYSVAAVTNATTYTWTVPIGWTIAAGLGTTSITVTTGTTGQNGNITVTAGNTCGTSAAATKTVTVYSAPFADAGADISSCIGDTVSFTNSTTGAISYSWDFGDGNTSTNENPQHLFTTAGNFTVVLVATNSDGCTGSDNALILVKPSKDIYGYVGGNVTIGSVVILKYVPFQTRFDTADVVSITGTGDFHFANINHGNYIIKVFPDTLTYPTLIATYYGGAFLWNDSSVIVLSHDCDSNDTLPQITMLGVIGIGNGLGLITGQIIEGVNYGRSVGEPIDGVDVKLGKNPGGSIMATTITDILGTYAFSGVPLGNYTIYVDIPGLGRDSSYTFTIDSTNNQFLAENYIADSTSIYINPTSNVGISNPYNVAEKENKFNVYPNPVAGNTTIEYSISQPTGAKITLDIVNVLGVKIKSFVRGNQPMGNYKYAFNPQDYHLNSGVYFISLTMNEKINIRRIVVME